jgi:hypothetical protein
MQYSDSSSSNRLPDGLPLALVAGFALLIGIAIWSSVVMAAVSLIGGAIDEIDFDTSSGALAVDCAEDPDGLSLDQQILHEADCVTPTPVATSTPAPTLTPVRNRLDCDVIRGTDYLSRDERGWFLDNCVSR